jgi:hypothetical protein
MIVREQNEDMPSFIQKLTEKSAGMNTEIQVEPIQKKTATFIEIEIKMMVNMSIETVGVLDRRLQ